GSNPLRAAEGDVPTPSAATFHLDPPHVGHAAIGGLQPRAQVKAAPVAEVGDILDLAALLALGIHRAPHRGELDLGVLAHRPRDLFLLADHRSDEPCADARD